MCVCVLRVCASTCPCLSECVREQRSSSAARVFLFSSKEKQEKIFRNCKLKLNSKLEKCFKIEI